MNDLMNMGNEIEMTSLELVDLINQFRLDEGNMVTRTHYDFMKSIRKELEVLESLGLGNGGNISSVNYIDNKGETRPCYKLNKFGVMQMLNKESTLVRYKTQKYIEALENKLTVVQQHSFIEDLKQDRLKDRQQINEIIEQMSYIESRIGIRSKEVYGYCKHIKNRLGIERIDGDYKNIKQMFLFEMKVTKFEDIAYNKENIKVLDEICDMYAPVKQKKLFNIGGK